MKRLLTVLALALVPLLLLVNVWQGMRYSRLQAAVRQLEERQEEWFERNKKLLAAIAVYSSPGRLDETASEELELTRADQEQPAVRVEVTGGAGNDG